jgi:hypothetical protein
MDTPTAHPNIHDTMTDVDTTLAPPIPGPQVPRLLELASTTAARCGVAKSAWEAFLEVLAPLAAHNAETFAHSLRVGIYACNLAATEGLNARMALHGGCAHDMGKCLVPNSVLRTTSFTAQDKALLRNHPVDGQRLLAPTHLFSSYVAGLHHQFQPDPYGIDLDDVSLFALPTHVRDELYAVSELVATCDFYDALTTRDNTRTFVTDPKDPAQLIAAIETTFQAPTRARWLVDNDIVAGLMG